MMKVRKTLDTTSGMPITLYGGSFHTPFHAGWFMGRYRIDLCPFAQQSTLDVAVARSAHAPQGVSIVCCRSRPSCEGVASYFASDEVPFTGADFGKVRDARCAELVLRAFREG